MGNILFIIIDRVGDWVDHEVPWVSSLHRACSWFTFCLAVLGLHSISLLVHWLSLARTVPTQLHFNVTTVFRTSLILGRYLFCFQSFSVTPNVCHSRALTVRIQLWALHFVSLDQYFSCETHREFHYYNCAQSSKFTPA